ncbi:MAG: BMP family ABC transporter substrate-binding protein [Firmicutes bacterium]|nr:BMP family ABC transporter substrate-binding protein [Bacillota bacterium]
MKKFLVLLLALALVFAFAACGGGGDEGGEAAGDGIKIAVVSSPSGVDDGNFNQNIYEGIVAFCNDNGNAEVTPVQETTGDVAAAIQAAADIVADYDVIVCNGFQFAGIGTLAEENPDKTFILIDAFPTNAEGAETEYPNVYACHYLEQEGGFLAGIAAAMSTESGKVAVINGIAYPSNVNYQYGFEAGVAYANAHLGTAAECVEIAAYAGTDVTGANVGGNYIGDFADEATGKVVAEALIAQGCDVLFVAAGGSGNGSLTACKEAGIYYIGCDVDQYDDGVNGDSNVILTSALKCMDSTVYSVLTDYANGEFAGGNFYLDAKTDSTGAVVEDGRQQLSPEAIDAIKAAFEGLKDGSIVPPANFNGLTPEDFPGL